MNPDRIVLGVESETAKNLLLELYRPLNTTIIVTDIKSAEIIKHASNSFLAVKISFINAISRICESTGADVVKVAEGMGLDKRNRPGILRRRNRLRRLLFSQRPGCLYHHCQEKRL